MSQRWSTLFCETGAWGGKPIGRVRVKTQFLLFWKHFVIQVWIWGFLALVGPHFRELIQEDIFSSSFPPSLILNFSKIWLSSWKAMSRLDWKCLVCLERWFGWSILRKSALLGHHLSLFINLTKILRPPEQRENAYQSQPHPSTPLIYTITAPKNQETTI